MVFMPEAHGHVDFILPNSSSKQQTLKMTQNTSQDEPSFPWEIGIYDAHCHPTDTMASVAEIPQMKATTLTIMATRGQDQDLVADTAAFFRKDASDTTRKEERVVPCFGWHPWFSHQIILDDITSPDLSDDDRKILHYKNALTPSPDESFILALPDPKPISQLISETRERLLSFPTALVGEIGLDRAFRLPNLWTQQDIENRDESLTPGSREGRTLSPHRVHIHHQKAVLEAQLRLAGELRRAVSVHSVQAHGAVFDLLKRLWSGHERKALSRRQRQRRRSAELAHEESDLEELESMNPPRKETQQPPPFPPRICMHSYSGPVEPIKQFLNQTNPSDVYFSFSSVINFHGPSAQKAMDVVKALPDDRVLIESDLHTAGQAMDDLLEEVTRNVCRLRGWSLQQGIQQLADNWKRFVFGST